jgi:membrane-associated HD superfamily phosphohydrolase
MIWPSFAANDGAVNQLAEEAAMQIKDQSEKAQQAIVANTPDSIEAQSYYHDLRQQQERNKLIEVVILCLLTLISLVIVLFYLSKSPNYSSSDMVNVTGLIFIISGTIILVLMADTEQQLTAAMGILGAVAGYLFGTMRKSDTKE